MKFGQKSTTKIEFRPKRFHEIDSVRYFWREMSALVFIPILILCSFELIFVPEQNGASFGSRSKDPKTFQYKLTQVNVQVNVLHSTVLKGHLPI
jgi:hypothetical protein